MLYDFAFALFSIFYLPTLIFKGKLHRDFFERFGAYGREKLEALRDLKEPIWIQAVSVGEVALCRNFIPLLKQKCPGRPVILSTITKTGNDYAKKLFGNSVTVIYFPLDFLFVVASVIAMIKPKVFVMVETEIWPNFLREIERNKIPAIMINGRISDRSIGKYRIAKPFICRILRNVNALCMQSKTDADRIIELGARPERVKVTGSMKFDAQAQAVQKDAGELRKALGMAEKDELLVAGSTHPGEEAAILAAYKELLPKFPNLKLLIAPRHIERANEVAGVIKKGGFEPIMLSKSPCPLPLAPCPRVYVLDTIGRLNDYYSIATIVFVGGSLIKHGGQNPIEPAIHGKPVVFGRYMFNFKNIAEAFLAKDAAVKIDKASELASVLDELLADKLHRDEMGRLAKEVIAANRGATEKNLAEITRFLNA